MPSIKFKKSELIFDSVVLVIIWAASFLVPDSITLFNLVTWSVVLKIVALLGTLEFVGFFAILLLGERSSILIQGLLGGLVSSTATFLHFTQKDEYKDNHPRSISRALLLATMAMLLEGIFIIFSLAPQNALTIARPFFVQFFILALFVIFLKVKNTQNVKSTPQKKVLDEVIIWKNVMTFALLMLSLIFMMRFLESNFAFPPLWSAFIMSLFEAHAVLAAAIHEYGQATELIIAVLIGNVLSKSFFVMRAKNKAIRIPVLGSLYVSLLLGLLSIFLN